ncbi:MAG: DNA replication complex GINS family protein [Candidatus Thermoplasmatota archaeon]|jgi:DNA replication initiation complex subunit (GINS family)|nr:DNA replication complex GINS family protein [Candidatus Thermoplasmatota archaeon]
MKGDINRNFLNSMVRLEIKNIELTEVPSTFYKDVKNYLDDLRTRIETETIKKNSRTASRLNQEMEDSEGFLKRIVEQRISKILQARALSDKEMIEGKLTPEEQIFYENLSNAVSDFSEELLKGEIILEKNEQKEKTEKPEVTDTKEEKEEEKFSIVHILQDIPDVSIMGRKLILRKEDIVTLPEKYADIINKQGLGKKLT